MLFPKTKSKNQPSNIFNWVTHPLPPKTPSLSLCLDANHPTIIANGVILWKDQIARKLPPIEAKLGNTSALLKQFLNRASGDFSCGHFLSYFLNLSLWNTKCENMLFVCWPSIINSRKGRQCPNMWFMIDFFPHTFFNFQAVALSLSLLGRWGGCSEPSKRSICWVRDVDRGHDSLDGGEDDGDGGRDEVRGVSESDDGEICRV